MRAASVGGRAASSAVADYGQRKPRSLATRAGHPSESLPIYKLRNELVRAIAENQVLIVIGDTGSGKVRLRRPYLATFFFFSRAVLRPRRVDVPRPYAVV